MKLLTWMHRKLRQNNNEILKEYPLGHTIYNNSQQLGSKQNHGGGTNAHPPSLRDNSYARNSFTSLEYVGLDALDDTDLPTEFSGPFHGFLAIGTLGVETFISEPETPTFSISVDNIAERETAEVTESELKLINDELEKVLAAEAKEDGWTDSSGRNSYISSTGRSSHASTITLNGKMMEIMDTTSNINGTEKTVCPLQGYLFGSAVELPEGDTSHKINRTSLSELFQRHKAEEISATKSERSADKLRSHKDSDKTAINLISKIIKRKTAHPPPKNTTAATGRSTESTSAETKLHKMLHVFHKKVHPESSKCMPRLSTQHRCGTKNRDSSKAGYVYGEHMLPVPDEDFDPLPGGTDTTGNKGFWIKTDSDYLVLEL